MAHAEQAIDLCASADLHEGGRAVVFELRYRGQNMRAFAVRYQGQVHAYLNQCSHVAMELDIREGHFFDDSGHWLLCANHGAAFQPDTGACVAGPGRGGLLKIALSEENGLVRWHTAPLLQPIVW